MPHHLPASLRICLLALLLWIGYGGSAVEGQTLTHALRKQADGYYASGHYAAALQLYRQGESTRAKDPELRYRMAYCLFAGNEPDQAIRILQSLAQERKPGPDVFHLMARAYMSMGAYASAMAQFKEFLRRIDADHPDRRDVKDQIIRCAYGLRLKHADEQAFVENAGADINTPYDEFAVLTSPTVMDRIYFHSNRRPGGTLLRPTEEADIFTSAIVNGRWQEPRRLPPHINTTGHELGYGFSTDGQVLIFLQSDEDEGVIRTDTFTQDPGVVRQGVFDPTFPAHPSRTDLYFLQDSVCVYSAILDGGLGGYDLYLTVRREGRWQAPVNLGPSVNTPYDERFPFLTLNGRTLYFSSNRLESAGGYDVWKTDFLDARGAWTALENLGFPINSPGDDTWFTLSPDGMSGYLSSDRKTGLGGHDIYRVFFKQQVVAHQQISAVPTFFHVLEAGGTSPASVMPMLPEAEKKTYYLSHLFLDGQNEVLTPQNIKKLDVLVSLLQTYPGISVELNGFQASADQRLYNLYFSVKQADKAADYLVRQGIAPSRIFVKGYGASFPILHPAAGVPANALVQRLAQRIEITPLDFADEPVDLHVERIQVPDNVAGPTYRHFQEVRKGLYYGVQIAATTQMLHNPDLEPREAMFIEYDRDKKWHKYLVGFSAEYRQAERDRLAMHQMGFLQAFIVPFVDGRRITESRARELVDTYPDLAAYLEGLK